MKLLSLKERINNLEVENNRLQAENRRLEADLVYLAMMVGVDLQKGESADANSSKEKEQNV